MALVVWHVQDAQGQPLSGAQLHATGGPGPWATTTNPCGDAITQLAPATYEVTFTHPGAKPRVLPATIADAGVITTALESARPGPQPRAPLPPLDLAGPDTVHTSLPSNLVVPKGPDKTFMRGNAWGIPIPGGLPFVPSGTSSVHPDRCLDWFLDEYIARDASAADRIFAEKAKRGYTDFLMSRGGGFGHQSSADYAQLALKVKQAGFFVNHMLTSKVIDPNSAPAQTYIDLVQPYLDLLLDIGAIDRVCHGWELNTFWVPAELARFKQWLRNYLPPRIAIASHFTSYVTAWQLDGEPRALYWKDGCTDELWYQANQNDHLGQMQAHLNDAMVQASGLQANDVRLVWFEVSASNQFDGRPMANGVPADEDQGDMYGFGGLCTPGPIACQGGFMNGARNPDGTVI